VNRKLPLTAALSGLSLQMLAVPAGALPPSSASSRVTLYRDGGCGCCEGWAAATKAAGYSVDVNDIEHSARLRRFAIPPDLAGCHTAVVGRYLVGPVGSAHATSSGAPTDPRHRLTWNAEWHTGYARLAYDEAHCSARCSGIGSTIRARPAHDEDAAFHNAPQSSVRNASLPRPSTKDCSGALAHPNRCLDA
jgi:hypothetical protein